MGRQKDDGDEKPALTTDDKFELLIAALTQRQSESGGLSKDALREILAEQAKERDPSNKTHPGHSSLSHPDGDRAHPREHILPFEVMWNGFAVHKWWETHHYRELELLAQLQPGEYTVMRKDGSIWPEKVKVEATRDAAGRVTRLTVTFSVQRGEKDQVAPLFVTAYQMVHADRPLRKTFVEAMNAWMEMTLGEEPATVN